jgi:serine/threonine-protein kinase SRPK3
LPQNFSQLSQEERDRLFNDIRKNIELEQLKKAGIETSHPSNNRTEDTDSDKSIKRQEEIKLESTDIELKEPLDIELNKKEESNIKNMEFQIPKLKTNLIENALDVKDGVKTTRRGPKLNEDAMLTIVDMGNGCWTHHHYTSQIQTRQYRSPETIIGVPYGPSADIWSMGCMIFELLTGDFVFEPKKGSNYDKDDDHLAQMIELLGAMPKNFALSGKNSKRFFDSTGHLRKIRGLNYWPIDRVLIEKYRFKPEEALPLADFF